MSQVQLNYINNNSTRARNSVGFGLWSAWRRHIANSFLRWPSRTNHDDSGKRLQRSTSIVPLHAGLYHLGDWDWLRVRALAGWLPRLCRQSSTALLGNRKARLRAHHTLPSERGQAAQAQLPTGQQRGGRRGHATQATARVEPKRGESWLYIAPIWRLALKPLDFGGFTFLRPR